MSKVRHLAEGMALPEWFLDSLQELIATYASPNFAVTQASPTTLRVVAGPDNDQVCIALSKSGTTSWRRNTATVSAGVPGGLAVGDHDIYVTSFANLFDNAPPTHPPTEADNTQYGFFLLLKAAGTTPTGAGGTNQEMYRKVGTFRWDGLSISQPGVSLFTPPTQLFTSPPNTQPGSYTLVISDANKTIEMAGASTQVCYIPNDSTVGFPIGTIINVAQLGGGATYVQGAGGVTVRCYNNNTHLAGVYAVASVIKRAANDWYLAGNLVP